MLGLLPIQFVLNGHCSTDKTHSHYRQSMAYTYLDLRLPAQPLRQKYHGALGHKYFHEAKAM